MEIMLECSQTRRIRVQQTQSKETIMSNKAIVIILTVLTALMHLGLGIPDIPNPMGILFIFNSLGYLALLAGLYFIPQLVAYRIQVRYALIGYTLVTIVAYFVVHLAAGDSVISPGLANKAIEVALVAALWMGRDV
jgi:hypothetical protein